MVLRIRSTMPGTMCQYKTFRQHFVPGICILRWPSAESAAGKVAPSVVAPPNVVASRSVSADFGVADMKVASAYVLC